MRRCRVAGLALALGVSARAGGQASSMVPPSSATVPGSEITVVLVTFGLGEEVFERFGHNALWFHDAQTGEDIAYQWGLFNFNEPGFIARFLTGDNRYQMGPEDPHALIERERRASRPVTLQRLRLTPEEKLALRTFVRWNARDENKFYRYDYFRDNCSTRLRDALDRALGGKLKRATDTVMTQLTYRRESVRLTDGDAPIQAGIDIALGRPADARLSEWDSFFIPMRLRDALRDVRVPQPNGMQVSLIEAEQNVQPLVLPLPGVHPVEELAIAPRIAPRFALVGIVLAAFVVLLRATMDTQRGAAWALAIVGSAWSLLSGVLGIILLLAWFATRHVFWSYNDSVLLLTPLSLVLVPLIPLALLYGRVERAAHITAVVIAVFAAVALILAVLPGGQENRAVVALILPMHIALAWALVIRRKPAVSNQPSAA